eukprot:8826690-Alexandrium_andersonii.AAC.1
MPAEQASGPADLAALAALASRRTLLSGYGTLCRSSLKTGRRHRWLRRQMAKGGAWWSSLG